MIRPALMLGLLALCAPSQSPVPHHLVQVVVPDGQAMARLVSMDLDLAACMGVGLGDKSVDVIATDADIARLRAAGFAFDVAIRRLEEHYQRQLAPFANPAADTLTPPLGQGAMGGHYTLAQMEAFLDSFHANYPDLITAKVSLGKSIEGRDVWMVKISDNADTDEPEPEVYYDALHHAREPLGMGAMIQFMDELLSGYGTDPEATYIVDNRELYFVPCVNPDGYEFNFQTNPGGGGLWRKNRRNHGGGDFGVDLNRNYATYWHAPNGGNSTDITSSIYRGAAPFSEPETAAIEAFMTSRNFVQTFSVHAYTDILLRPWSFDVADPTNVAEYQVVGDALTAANGIEHGGTAEVLYIAAGGAIDHHHLVHGALSWTPELGRGDEGGFWPDPSKSVEISNRHQTMFRVLALTSGPYLGIESVSVVEGSGADGDGIVEPGETGEIVVSVRNRGAADATGSASLMMTSLSTGIVLGTSSVSVSGPPRFGAVDNGSNPLTFAVPSTYPDALAHLRLTLTGEGLTVNREVDVLSAELRVAVDDDMERDRGFQRSATDTATTGRWQRAQPQETRYNGVVIQPGHQHTPGGQLSWITHADPGASVGQFDVDGGYTDLLSPVFDLSHLVHAEVRAWRWYGESDRDDPFVVFVSEDGGNTWTEVFSDRGPTDAWTLLTHFIESPTDSMRFRFRAQDLNPSLVEAGIDDFEIAGVMPDGRITLMSSGKPASQVRVGMTGAAGGIGYLFLSHLRISPQTIPGVDGLLHLPFAAVIPLPPAAFATAGYAVLEVTIPDDPSLVGQRFYWQMVYQQGSELSLSNLQILTIK